GIATSTRQGTEGVGSTTVLVVQACTYRAPEAVWRTSAGCVRSPRPQHLTRTTASPGSRTPAGQKVSRDSVTTAVPVPPPDTSNRLYAARAGTPRALRYATLRQYT